MGSGPKFAKLRKAILRGTVEEIKKAMFDLRFRPEKAKTHGENIRRETMRALRQLKNLHQAGVPAKVQVALKLAEAEAGPLWNQGPVEQPAAQPVVVTSGDQVNGETSQPAPTEPRIEIPASASPEGANNPA